MEKQGPLAGLRVLDLADEKGALAGKLLGDLGADVVKVERPGGDPMRNIPPFLGGTPHRERSLFFWAYNTSKRGITLDITRPAGRSLFARLAARADVVIETFPPGTLEALGLGYEALAAAQPRLVLVSITPCGQSGPYRDLRASDTVLQALGGMAFVNGHPDEPPLRALGCQAYHAGSIYAAIATLGALFARETTGRGQWVDVSLQAATVAALEQVTGLYRERGRVTERQGSLHWTRYFRLGRCRDGYVLHCTLGDWTSLLEWVKSEGAAADLEAPEWEDPAHRRRRAEHLFDVLDAWAAGHTVAEVVEGAQLRRIPYAPVLPPESLFANPQLAARGFFVPVDHPELGRTVTYPGAPFRLEDSPCGPRRRPPLVGEHNGEVYREELGLDEEELAVLAAEGVV